MAARTLIFDLDGTLWDSYGWYASLLAPADQQRCAEVRRRLEAGASIIGLANSRGLSKSSLVRRCGGRFNELQLYPNVRETLRELALRGARLGVVTSLSGEIAECMLDGVGLADLFGTIVHPGNCRSRKPCGAPLERALAVLGGETRTSVYVGDKDDDATCARNAGVRFAWASYGYGSRPDGDIAVLRDFAEVLKL